MSYKNLAATLTLSAALSAGCDRGPSPHELVEARKAGGIATGIDCTREQVMRLEKAFWSNCYNLGEGHLNLDALVAVRDADCGNLLEAGSSRWTCRYYEHPLIGSMDFRPNITTAFKPTDLPEDGVPEPSEASPHIVASGDSILGIIAQYGRNQHNYKTVWDGVIHPGDQVYWSAASQHDLYLKTQRGTFKVAEWH